MRRKTLRRKTAQKRTRMRRKTLRRKTAQKGTRMRRKTLRRKTAQKGTRMRRKTLRRKTAQKGTRMRWTLRRKTAQKGKRMRWTLRKVENVGREPFVRPSGSMDCSSCRTSTSVIQVTVCPKTGATRAAQPSPMTTLRTTSNAWSSLVTGGSW
ncbi:uncharacterized protein LOC117764652 isoform X1 [Hippoglossus hippoglossus]|uniref:uncharacterized protein LOC117764652 isoform X1 n=1 Tax=Hippoglossus hippoglossus TaxID=8267 RepID=UPI00148E1409|nr:uncharacterized protein LOC117764652 isoform X1 [Hippoglossus hippoglossus]